MRIVIDLQGAQASSRLRGIGRYSLSIAKAICRNKGRHEILIALNGIFETTIEPIRAEFEGLLAQKNIRVWHVPSEVNDIDIGSKWRQKTAELIRESFLATLRPDMVLVTSLFEGFNDNAVTSIGTLSLGIPTSVILYDLIPLIHRKQYLESVALESWYENKLDNLRRANLLLGISESSKNEGINYLGFPSSHVINIATAADQHFKPYQVSHQKETELRQRYNLRRPFVMYTSVPGYRKNHDGLIRAYSKLKKELRDGHQLLLACSSPTESYDWLKELPKKHGLVEDDVVFIGFVPDNDLVTLYNLCKLFVFPSWHEGFGLPALEAMSCGSAVIAANTSSLPEVIGRNDALFDPHDEESITNKLEQVLTDDVFRQQLEHHGLNQAVSFSWDITAKAAIDAIETWHKTQTIIEPQSRVTGRRPKLAYVSPLPPERSGISDYSAVLLPELARHYEIEVIVAQDTISDLWVKNNCLIRDVEWFKTHANCFDRVVYHFGNSHFHQHMFSLIDEIPGIVVLHDFYLGHVVEYMAAVSGNENTWPSTLYREHGYSVVNERYQGNVSTIAWDNPCNLSVLQKSVGIVVHSENSKLLAAAWYGEHATDDWALIPLMRTPAFNNDRIASRIALGIEDDAFVVCSFGFIGQNKNNHRLLDSWLDSLLAHNEKCLLIFVGENGGGDYGNKITEKINMNCHRDRVRITGWTDTATFQHYLTAADVGVQLRTLSRGETSAAVLDCMNFGLATIVNANGSLAELANEGVWKLPDDFENAQLIKALETLWQDDNQRHTLGIQARKIVHTLHAPRTCADQYAQAIEAMYRSAGTNALGLTSALVQVEFAPTESRAWEDIAKSIALSISSQPRQRQLLIDISALVQIDIKTGIQRVVRSILRELLINPPPGYRVEPIYATHIHNYCYARKFTLTFLGCPDSALVDEPIEFNNGDIYLGLDLHHNVVLNKKALYQKMRDHGVQVYFVVYDLLPVFRPDVFPEGSAALHASWLNTISQTDGAICISRSVADEFSEWISIARPDRLRPFKIGWFHLGGDVSSSVPTSGLPANAKTILRTFGSRPTFLMVGTIEPRKGYIQTLLAFEKLWSEKIDVNLVIVGHEGWKGLSNEYRRTIPLITSRLLNHPELGHHLFWLQGVSDEYLEDIYNASTCLIAASEGEGFGLPLIEASQHKLPIIARDIPVFREVALNNAYYFSGLGATEMARAVKDWLLLSKAGNAPKSDTMPWLTWAQSSEQLLDVVLRDKWMTHWMQDGGYRYFGADTRLHSQVGKPDGLDIHTTGVAGCILHGPYLALEPGTYQIRIHGHITSSGTPPAYADIAIQKGSKLLSSTLIAISPQSGLIGEMKVSLNASVTDFEVRVWVSKKSDLSISKLEILPELLFDKGKHLSNDSAPEESFQKKPTSNARQDRETFFLSN